MPNVNPIRTDTEDYHKNHHNNPYVSLMDQISKIQVPQPKRNYFDVLQHMTADNGHFYGRRCFGTKYDNGKMGQYWLKPNQNVEGHISLHHSCYATVNTFKIGGSLMKNKKTGRYYYWYHHSKNLVTGLCGLYVDLDAKQIGLEYGRQIAPILPKLLLLSKLPEPSFVVDSGHGLHVLWLFDHEVKINKPVIKAMWQKVENYFVDHMSDASITYVKSHRHSYAMYTYLTRDGHYDLVDHNVDDSTRYLRVPESYNCKNREHEILVNTLEDNYVSYSLFGHHRGLYYTYIGRFSKKHTKHNKKYKTSSNIKNRSNKKSEKASSNVVYNGPKIKELGKLYFLLMNRIADYKELIYLRNKHENTGYRNEILFQYVLAKTQLRYSKKDTLSGARKMNKRFNLPLEDDEVVGIARAGEHTNYSNLDNYHYSNDWIMSSYHLNISANEQKYMATLMDKKERNRRKKVAKEKSHKRVIRWRRKRGLGGQTTSTKWKRMKLQFKAIDLYKRGLSKASIARKLGKNKSTITRWINNYRSK